MLFPSSRRRRVSQVVTVIMKTFQRPQTAARAVDHLRRYYPEIRLLIADDSREALAFSHPQAEVVRLPFDSGVSKGRNALLERVETEYFLLMDDDHWFSRQTRLDRMLEILERERFDILACHVWFRRHTERMFPKRRLNNFFLNLRLEDGTLELIEGYHQKARAWRVCDMVENFFIARTERVRELGGWDDRLKVAEHAEFFIRAKRLRVEGRLHAAGRRRPRPHPARAWLPGLRSLPRPSAGGVPADLDRQTRHPALRGAGRELALVGGLDPEGGVGRAAPPAGRGARLAGRLHRRPADAPGAAIGTVHPAARLLDAEPLEVGHREHLGGVAAQDGAHLLLGRAKSITSMRALAVPSIVMRRRPLSCWLCQSTRPRRGSVLVSPPSSRWR